jgi:alcohol dehydrogenase
MVEKAAEIARSEAIDGIVAIGGGSAIDTAKGINVLINNPPLSCSILAWRKT